MGILGRIKKALAPSVDQRIREDAAKKVDGLRDLISKGASKEKLDAYLEEVMSSTEFNEVLGSLKQSAPLAQLMALQKHVLKEDVDERLYDQAWASFTRAQKDADRFFRNSQMRSWVVARSLKEYSDKMTWEFIDELLGEDDSWGVEFRSKLWWLIPWSFAIAEEVEDRHGKGSCDSSKFHATWSEMTNEETVKAFLDTLSAEQVSYYRCVD